MEGLHQAELNCAVNIMEPSAANGQNGPASPVMVQKKKTFYPQWGHCFDGHVYQGRVMQIIVINSQDVPVAQVTVELEVLQDECKEQDDPTNAVMLQVSSISFLVTTFQHRLLFVSDSKCLLFRISCLFHRAPKNVC